MSRERRESEPWAAPPHCNSSRPNPPACSRREPRRTAPGRSHSRELPPPHPAHPAADTRAGRDVPGARPPAGEPSAVFAPPSDGALPAALRAWLEAERFPALSVVERHNFFGMLSKDEHRTAPRASPPPAPHRPLHLPSPHPTTHPAPRTAGHLPRAGGGRPGPGLRLRLRRCKGAALAAASPAGPSRPPLSPRRHFPSHTHASPPPSPPPRSRRRARPR